MDRKSKKKRGNTYVCIADSLCYTVKKKKKKKHNIVKQLYSNQKEKEVAPIID